MHSITPPQAQAAECNAGIFSRLVLVVLGVVQCLYTAHWVPAPELRSRSTTQTVISDLFNSIQVTPTIFDFDCTKQRFFFIKNYVADHGSEPATIRSRCSCFVLCCLAIHTIAMCETNAPATRRPCPPARASLPG
ncbi:uncharacterized protein BO66DRAFT_186670 [Aspergillus aculeatinus CBS 121060]|uniref:Uncharacterized protein n=1 Tax=Aspergillus aculeatinus CBS 121060 TaxID=1448322 RepID=A0ACD1GY63_9EURO|nr:hypothetical protein BO66DRAFT_186670 [Aspergillus aculeatinus CBS 121060]RAH66248.1 hypothetical protein BO66DRAFT_186670 [Aspergillus aculeatinus CBS 121060]